MTMYYLLPLILVHALSKQAQTTTTLLHGIVEKLNLISDALPAEAGVVGISESHYPHLYQYLHQAPEPHHYHGYNSSATTKSGVESSSESRFSAPSGLALLGQNTAPMNRRPTATSAAIPAAGTAMSATSQGYPHHHASSRTAGIAVPKARASMALASSLLNFLPMQSTSISDLDSTFGSLSMDNGSSGGGLLSVSPIPRSLSADMVQESGTGQGQGQWDATGRRMNEGNGVMSPPQQRTMRASDNLRRLANKPAPGT